MYIVLELALSCEYFPKEIICEDHWEC